MKPRDWITASLMALLVMVANVAASFLWRHVGSRGAGKSAALFSPA